LNFSALFTESNGILSYKKDFVDYKKNIELHILNVRQLLQKEMQYQSQTNFDLTNKKYQDILELTLRFQSRPSHVQLI